MRKRLLAALFAALLPSFASAALAEAPPIPDMADRARFIAGHHGDLDPGAWQRERDVHEEYDVLHYDISLSLDYGAQVLTGTVVMTAESRVADLARIELDFYAPMVVDAVSAGGAPTGWSHVYHTLTVDLDASYQPGEAFTVTSEFHGHPVYSLDPFRWLSTYAGEPMICSYSEPYGAPAWWVCKDDPNDKATCTIQVTARDDLFTVSNGALVSHVDNGDGTATSSWATGYPTSTYLVSIATTSFAHWSEPYTALDGETAMDVDYYCYPERLAQAQESWSGNVGMMEYYAGVFGEYPFLDEKYSIAQFAHTGAMEHQTTTSMGAGWVNGAHNYDYIVAHELAHSWVGDMITMAEWSHAWTKEGFATFCEAIYFESLYGESYYHGYMNAMNPTYYGQFQLFDISPPLAAPIYYKGAWVLHMLRHVLGDAAFFAGIALYTSDPDLRYGNGNTEELRDAFESAAGVDLDRFFDQWIFNPGFPHYTLHWGAEPAGGGYDLELVITQDQQSDWPVFQMPVDINVRFGLSEQRFVVLDSLRTQAFTLHVDQAPVAVELDPDGWLIKLADEVTAVAAAPALTRLAPATPNPFNPKTTLSFSLAEAGGARLSIHDAGGREVRVLCEGTMAAGIHELVWDGRDDAGRALPSGVYFQRLSAGGETHGGRAVLLK